MDLKQYEEQKFAIADVIRTALSIDTADVNLRSAGHELLVRLAEDRFNLMVVGRFNRGKSTLLNALLGRSYLPTGIVPLTSVITTIRYGSRAQVLIHYVNSSFRSEVPLERLEDYVTQQSNPGNAKGIAFAEIQLPVEILRRGYFFVDSPGLGSSIRENTRTTEQFIPEADAFILVTSYDSALSEEEDTFLEYVSRTKKKLFVVLNKQDTVNHEEQAATLAYLRERLSRYRFGDAPGVFSLSARLGLAEKEPEYDELAEKSGLSSFEAELSRFLIEGRAKLFLENMHRRVMTFLTGRIFANPAHENRTFYEALLKRFKEQEENTGIDPEHVVHELRAASYAAGTEFALSFDKKTGCRICGVILDVVFKFLSRYQYDLTINPEAQQEHAQRNGFCPLHTWQYENISSPYGVCTSYPALAHHIAEKLSDAARVMLEGGRALFDLKELLPTAKTCRICEVRRDAERKAIEDAASAAREALATHQSRLPACCLQHLTLVASTLGTSEAAQLLIRSHASLLERTAEDLRRYALRHDALRRHLTSDEERSAATLILLLLAGHRSVSAPWNVETLF
jgi:GTP-binding protein EngB required for normal cell division